MHYLDDPEALKLIVSNSIYTEQEILEKIKTIKKATTLEAVLNLQHIEYIAPYTFKDLNSFSKKIDYIASQVVLEHVHPEFLDELFKFRKISFVYTLLILLIILQILVFFKTLLFLNLIF